MNPPVALVTGANRGIGWHTTLALAGRGYFVLLGCRVEERGRNALADIRRASGEGAVLVLDVANPAAAAGVAAMIESRYGRLDVLVNNAGVFYHPEDLTLGSLGWEAFDRSIRTNLSGPVWLTRACLPLLTRSVGRIVNVTSDMARVDTADGAYTAYRITKAGLDAFTINLAVQLRETGVLVNAVDPGWVRTDMGGPDAPDAPNEAAALVAWAATLPPGGPSGKVFCLASRPPARPSAGVPLVPVTPDTSGRPAQ
jgi:NAD(P)-dependent dehydrogenase (short-subunit alcohol dehydrogenase family)